MRKIIQDLIAEKPRHFTRVIKNNSDMLQWVNDNSLTNSESLPERIYSAVQQESGICSNGNNRRFKSVNEGFGFCGRASQCECARLSVAQKVSDSKQQYSDKKKKEITSKRKETTLKKYGVCNNGQTPTAKKKHKDFYNDATKVEKVVLRSKETKLVKYGDENYNNPIQIKKTLKLTFGGDYWQERFPEKSIDELQNKDTLLSLYKSMTIEEISQNLSVHPQTVYRYLNLYGIREPFKSSEEAEVVRFLRSLGISNIIENSRKILESGKELDVFLPDHSVAIEYNGAYWHHDGIDHITRSYHKKKFTECEAKGIQLLTIFSPLWKSKKDLVKRIITNKLGLNKQSVFARQCQIITVTTHEARDFLNKNHIQGYTTASIRYGLEHNGTLVAIMTFGKTRVGMGCQEDASELIRYATSTRVVGGASKLLKHFTKNNTPNKIFSYSDNEWSNGGLYQTLGFTLDKDIPPSYWYLKPREERLYHRYNFAKHKLVEKGFTPDKTERQITKEMGLLKIWDCGKKKWVLDFVKKKPA